MGVNKYIMTCSSTK